MSKDIKNPANSVREDRRERAARVPMSLPTQKLAVPDIPGYHLHWMIGTPSRIQQALKAGYEFVDPEETEVNNFGLADDASKSGNTDMGSRVSVLAGSDAGESGQGDRLFLMKIKQEWWEEDQKVLEQRNEQVAATLRGGQDISANQYGTEQRYIPDAHRKGVASLFTPKSRRA